MSAPKVAPRRDMIWVWFRYSEAAVLMPLDSPPPSGEGQLSRLAPGFSPSMSKIPSRGNLSAGGLSFSTLSCVEFAPLEGLVADPGRASRPGIRGIWGAPRLDRSSRQRSSKRTTWTRALRAALGTGTAVPESSAREFLAASLLAWIAVMVSPTLYSISEESLEIVSVASRA